MLAVSQKQDRLLYLCAYLLLNLSEDPDIERKMQKKVGLVLTALLYMCFGRGLHAELHELQTEWRSLSLFVPAGPPMTFL